MERGEELVKTKCVVMLVPVGGSTPLDGSHAP